MVARHETMIRQSARENRITIDSKRWIWIARFVRCIYSLMDVTMWICLDSFTRHTVVVVAAFFSVPSSTIELLCKVARKTLDTHTYAHRHQLLSMNAQISILHEPLCYVIKDIKLCVHLSLHLTESRTEWNRIGFHWFRLHWHKRGLRERVSARTHITTGSLCRIATFFKYNTKHSTIFQNHRIHTPSIRPCLFNIHYPSNGIVCIHVVGKLVFQAPLSDVIVISWLVFFMQRHRKK